MSHQDEIDAAVAKLQEELPPSLAVTPNIPLRDQILEQLYAERDHWQRKIDAATGWGAGYSAAIKFRNACQRTIDRREGNKPEAELDT